MKLLERIEEFFFGTEEDQTKLNQFEKEFWANHYTQTERENEMKNPFEIRTEILEMAKDYMDKQFTLNMEIYTKMVEAGQKNMAELPKMYTFEELEKTAKQFYSFVQTKD